MMKYKIVAGAIAFSVCLGMINAGESKKEFNTGVETNGISFNEGSSTYVQDQTLAPSRGLFKKTRVWTMPNQEGQARDIGIREVKYATYKTKLIKDEGGRSRWCPIPIHPEEEGPMKQNFKAVPGDDGKFKAQRIDNTSLDSYYKTMVLTTNKTWAEPKRRGTEGKKGEELYMSIVKKMNKQNVEPITGKLNLKQIPRYVNLELVDATVERVILERDQEDTVKGSLVWVKRNDGTFGKLRAEYVDPNWGNRLIEVEKKTLLSSHWISFKVLSKEGLIDILGTNLANIRIPITGKIEDQEAELIGKNGRLLVREEKL